MSGWTYKKVIEIGQSFKWPLSLSHTVRLGVSGQELVKPCGIQKMSTYVDQYTFSSLTHPPSFNPP